jgi:peptide/nickel transport system substrate-binding protein/oligopeptide transport system substrate-binding protein
MQQSKKCIRRLVLTFLVLPVMLLVACSPGNPAQQETSRKAPPDKQVFTMPLTGGSDISTFDPALAGDSLSISSISNVFTGLVELNRHLDVVPQLAASYSESADGLTWTFHLKLNLQFSDGTPLTSHDVVYSIDRALQPATKSLIGPIYLALIKDSDKLVAGKLKTIIGDSLLTPDDRTVVIITNKRVAYFLDTLSYSTSYVVEKSVIEKWGVNWTDHLSDNGGQGGDGPWKVSEYTHGKQIVFVPNPNYYGPRPQLTKLIYPFYKKVDTVYQVYQANQVDLAGFPGGIPAGDIAQAKMLPDHQYQQIPQLWINFYAMNYLVKPFDNIHIRQALDLAINKDLIVHSVWRDSLIPTNHIVPQGMPGYNPNLIGPDGVAGTSGDAAKARALFQQGLQEEGWTSVSQVPELTLTYPIGGIDQDNEVAALIQMWQTTLGVRVKANPEDINKLLLDVGAAQNNPNGLQFWGLAWLADYPDPQDWTTLQFDKGSQYNQFNYGQNNSANAAQQQVVQQELEAADVNPDQHARLQVYMQAEQQLVNDVAWLPIEQVATNLVLKPYVKGLVFNAMDIFPPDDWSAVYIAAH